MRTGAWPDTSFAPAGDYQELIVDYPDGRFMCMLRNNGQVQSLMPLKGR